MLRITGGIFKSREIYTLPGQKTRPTQAKVRQALFHSLVSAMLNKKNEVKNFHVLDLFAGSGALGFEALSRGADQVTFVEKSYPAIKIIEKNAKLLNLESKIRLVSTALEKSLDQVKKDSPFYWIFADPPYALDDYWSKTLINNWPWHDLLHSEGMFSIETSTAIDQKNLPKQTSSILKYREKKYGDTLLTLYQKTIKGDLLEY